MAIYYGVFDKSEEQTAFERLMDYIKENGNNFDCGFLGMHVLFHVLSKFGQSELAYNMITKKEFPSYAYLIEQGETSLVELFREEIHPRISHNHHFFGDIARWFMTCIAGLNVVDYKTVEIRPIFIENLTYASAFYELPSGKISILWERTDCNIILKVICDEEISYNIILPEGYVEGNNVIVKKL